MVADPRVLALIPARGGSKSLPRKNIRVLAGRPLLAHSIDAAFTAKTVDRIVVSTDDEEIAEVARRHGAEVPFLRPPDIAQDDTPDLPVFRHALEWLAEREGWRPEMVVHLRPTSPLRSPEDIDRAVSILDATPDADAVRSVATPYENPFKMWTIADSGWLEPLLQTGEPEPYNTPRQKLPDVYWQTGAIDVTRRRTIMELGSMTGARIAPLVVDALGAVDIDTQMSFDQAEWLVRTGRVPWMRPAFTRPKLLALDFDGVLTDNHVWVNEQGEEASRFDRGDGMGIALVRNAGVEVVVLSTEVNPIVEARCRKLGVPCHQALTDKAKILRDLASAHGATLADVAYVGNDVNDLACMEAVGLAFAVADAHPDVLHAAHVQLSLRGGHGAVREACDFIRTLAK